MEFKQEMSNYKQSIDTHKLKWKTDTKQILHNTPHKRSRHNIKRKTVEGHKCKKCQEKEKNKENHGNLFIEKKTTKQNHQTYSTKEIKICNTIKPSEATKYKERLSKDGLKMETRKKKEGNMIVYGDNNDFNRNKHISTMNTKKNQKQVKVTFSDLSDSSTIKQNKKSGMKNPHTRQKKTIHTILKLDSNLLIKQEGKIQKMKNINKQDELVQVQPENSNFLTNTKDSIEDVPCYREEMNIFKSVTSPLINIISVEENLNNIINIYDSRRKLKTEKPVVGDTEKCQKCQPQNEKENITKHNNVTEKEYLLAETGKQIEDIISRMRIQNEIQEENLCNKDNKKKYKFPNTFKDDKREETEKTNKKNSGTKSPDNATFNCDIYENSIGEITPRSQISLSESCLRLKTKTFKYKSRKNKILPTKHSSKNLSNYKKSKSLQNIKQNHIHNRFTEKKSKPQELTNFSVSKNSKIVPEKLENDWELDKININNTYPKYDSDNLSISASMKNINQEDGLIHVNEDQWCFADPELYSCDSELILEDGQITINSSVPTLPENSNDSWSNEKMYKSNISVFEINSVVSLGDLNENISDANNTLECSNVQDIEPAIHINTIQNEYNKIKSKSNENLYYQNKMFNNDIINHSCNISMGNNMSKRLIDTFPHQSAVTLISGFGSKCSFDHQKKSDGNMNQLNSSLKNIDISLNIKKDVAVSASTSYEIIRKTKFLTDKGIMCNDAVPSKVKKQRREKLKKIQQNNQRETKQICDTLLRKQGAIHYSHCKPIPDILNQRDKETIEKNNIFQHRKYKSIYSEKRQPRRSTKHHNTSNKEILQNKEENKTNTYIREEELEDVKIKFKDNFTFPYNEENVNPRQSKGFWNSLRTGSRRLVRFLQDSASFKYCFKKNMFK